MRLEFGNGRAEQRPIGLDGVPRVSPNGRVALPVALAGTWDGPNVFTFDYDEVANINSFRYRLTFVGDEVGVEVTEQTGLLYAHFKGERRNKHSGLDRDRNQVQPDRVVG